jgi:hypothetical protein
VLLSIEKSVVSQSLRPLQEIYFQNFSYILKNSKSIHIVRALWALDRLGLINEGLVEEDITRYLVEENPEKLKELNIKDV